MTSTEITTIIDRLKNTPSGTKLYSPICGECTFDCIDDGYILVTKSKHYFRFNEFGQCSMDGECLLFPSKKQRDWSNYQLPAPHYDFKPFDKVVVRYNSGTWQIDLFYSFDPTAEYSYNCMVSNWQQCLPFNEETAKLIGTTSDYDKEGI